MAAKKTYIEKLGLKTTDKLTPTICRQRVKFLKKRIEAGKYSGPLLTRARYYANWYSWRAQNAPK